MRLIFAPFMTEISVKNPGRRDPWMGAPSR
jgi:hypothetical protein